MQRNTVTAVSAVPRATDSVEKLKSLLGSAGQHLGDLVWWTLSDATTDRHTLESTWRTAGLDTSLLPEPPTAEKALKTSIRGCQVGQTERLIRLGKEDDAQLIFAIVHERRLDDGSLEHYQEARVILDRKREHLSSDVPGHEVAIAIQDAFSRLRTTHTPDDVRRAIVKALHSFAAVTLREGGGVYWVPRSFAEHLRRLQQAIEQLGASRFYLVPVHESADASRTLGEVARGSLESELADLQAELEAFKSAPPERASTLHRRMEAFEALRNRAQLYRDVLKVQVEDLERNLADMAASVEALLTLKAAA